jgi:hypothetical protein
VMLTQETSTISFQCYLFRTNLPIYWSLTFFNLVKHCRHMPSLVSNKCIYHPLSLIQQISSMKSIIYLLSLIFGPVTLKRICGDSLQQTHFGKVVWSSSIIRLKEKTISSLRQGARCWLASGTHIYSPSPYSPFMRKFMYPPSFCTTIIWKYLVGSGKPQKPLWNKSRCTTSLLFVYIWWDPINLFNHAIFFYLFSIVWLQRIYGSRKAWHWTELQIVKSDMLTNLHNWPKKKCITSNVNILNLCF